MNDLKFFSVAQIHMHPAWQARIEAAHSAHNINPLKIVRAILFKDGRVLHGILVGSRGSIDIAHAAIPGSWGIRMVVRDLSVLNYHMVREHAADGLMETAADSILGHGEIVPRFCMAGMDLGQRLVHAMQRDRRREGLEVRASTVALD